MCVCDGGSCTMPICYDNYNLVTSYDDSLKQSTQLSTIIKSIL